MVYFFTIFIQHHQKTFMQTKFHFLVFFYAIFFSGTLQSLAKYEIEHLDISNQNYVDQVVKLIATSPIQATMRPNISDVLKWIENSKTYCIIIAVNKQKVIEGVLIYFTSKNADLWIRTLTLSKNHHNKKIAASLLEYLESIPNISSISINVTQNSFNFLKLLQKLDYAKTQEFLNMHLDVRNTTLSNTTRPYIIRHVDQNNVQEVTEFAQLFNKNEVGVEYTYETMLEFMTKYPTYKFLAAFDNHNFVCGGIIYQILSESWKRFATAVHPNFRRHGIATALMNHLQNLALQAGIFELKLAVAPTNCAAQKCFQKAGYSFTQPTFQMVKNLAVKN